MDKSMKYQWIAPIFLLIAGVINLFQKNELGGLYYYWIFHTLISLFFLYLGIQAYFRYKKHEKNK